MQNLKNKKKSLTASNGSSVNMKRIFKYTFGGLESKYYFRQMFFSLAIFTMITVQVSKLDTPYAKQAIVIFLINAMLYPYSRFLYERIVGFVIGDGLFFVPALLLLYAKFVTMIICWSAAVVIAPISLIYLYFYNSHHSIQDS